MKDDEFDNLEDENGRIAYVDDFIDFIKENMPKNVTFAKNGERYKEVQKAITEIKDFVIDVSPDAKITVEPGKTFGSCLTMEIVADSFQITEIEGFCRALSKAATFEVLPRTDGQLLIGLTFPNAFKAISEND